MEIVQLYAKRLRARWGGPGNERLPKAVRWRLFPRTRVCVKAGRSSEVDSLDRGQHELNNRF